MASKAVASIALFLLLPLLVSSSGDSSNGGGGLLGGLLNGGSSNGNGNGLINLDLSLGNGANSNGNTGNLPPFDLPSAATFFGGSKSRISRSQCNTLNLGLCLNLLGLVNVQIGDVPTTPCCSLVQGLADLEAAVCVCTAVRANVLNLVDLNLPISLSLLLNNCGRQPAFDYQCNN